jgi:hypothetical protein
MSGNTSGAGGVVVPVPVLVERAMRRVEADRHAALDLPHRTHGENAVRCARMAAVEARRARWWAVLRRWTYSLDGAVPLVYGTAVIEAVQAASSAERFWTETAEYYRQRAAGIDPEETGAGWAS